MNQRYMMPALGHKEVQNVIKSVKKKKYNYRCKDQPICAVCNKQICLTKEFGVGVGEQEINVTFGRLVKIGTEPPIYIWDVEGRRMELSAGTLMSQLKFQRLCIEKLDKWPNTIKSSKWADIINEHLSNLEYIKAPLDASSDGIVLTTLEEFCNGKAQAKEKDELLLGLPWTEGGRTYFHGPRFLQELEIKRVRGMAPPRIWEILRRNGAQHHFWNLKGKGVNLWSFPEFSEQEEEFDPVEIPREEGEFS